MQRAEISPQLLTDVKDYLNITWEDEATDRKIRGLIASAANYLDAKSGVLNDYEQDGDARSLLLEHVRYARDGALDVFEQNYLHLLLAMQTDRQVITFAQNAVQT